MAFVLFLLPNWCENIIFMGPTSDMTSPYMMFDARFLSIIMSSLIPSVLKKYLLSNPAHQSSAVDEHYFVNESTTQVRYEKPLSFISGWACKFKCDAARCCFFPNFYCFHVKGISQSLSPCQAGRP